VASVQAGSHDEVRRAKVDHRRYLRKISRRTRWPARS